MTEDSDPGTVPQGPGSSKPILGLPPLIVWNGPPLIAFAPIFDDRRPVFDEDDSTELDEQHREEADDDCRLRECDD
jgi:hypothetical protein